MSEKIQPSHIEREAYVYIRQSSMQQVRTRLEGQRRQYDLRERAQALGFQRVVVIDEDLGRSGTGCVELPGFTPPADGCLLGSRGSCVGIATRSTRKTRHEAHGWQRREWSWRNSPRRIASPMPWWTSAVSCRC